jgi:Flp pilus assembly protein TadD
VKDEGEAIKLDPAQAKAYFYRGIAYARLGDMTNARNDFVISIRLDPALERYVTTNNKNSSDMQPP